MCPELWRLPQGLASLRDRRFALPAWDRENEVAQSESRPDRTTWVFPSVGVTFINFSAGDRHDFRPGAAELCAVAPDAMHDHVHELGIEGGYPLIKAAPLGA